jgi:hypothetical protein
VACREFGKTIALSNRMFSGRYLESSKLTNPVGSDKDVWEAKMASDPPKVFISYSHDSVEHAHHVLELAERLRADGVDARFDQYVVGTPAEGWPRWMLNQLDWADFVLAVCTETYYRRFRGLEDRAKGKGADWEGNLITVKMYEAKSTTTKFAPILLDGQNARFIPEPLRGHTHYLLNSEDSYAELYAFLTGQGGVRPGELGWLKTLARKQVEPLRFGISGTQARRTIDNLPFRPNPVFTGRGADMERFGKLLEKHSASEVTQIVVLHGLGGVGKTQLAVEYAWKRLGDYNAVFWVKADSPQALDTSLVALCEGLRLLGTSERKQAVQVKTILDWLNDHERWLLIADNADTDAAARAVCERFPPSLPGDILITSRSGDWPVNIQDIALDLLSQDESTRYLLARIGERQHEAGDETTARKLAEELGYLPLALEQAASFIVEMRWSFAKYQEQFRDARLELLSERGEGGTRYPASVAKTWSITVEQLGPLARALLRIAAWFAPDAIPCEIFSADKEVLSEVLSEQAIVSNLAIEKALGELDRFSLIRLAEKTVSVHRLLQAVEQNSIGEEERKQFLLWVARLFNAFAPQQPYNVRT